MTSFISLRRISSGGSAEVVLGAQQPIGSGQPRLMVLKRLLPQHRADKDTADRFMSEARISAGLAHPNIVAISEVVYEGQEQAIVMEYVSGEDLRLILEETVRASRRIPVALSVAIVARVAGALAHAHAMGGPNGGVVHRDISPSNIMIGYDGRVKVVDFGLARANNNDASSDPGFIKGKLPYISPEHAHGRQVTARSDLFSLGAVFHEMLTSRRLFNGPTQAAILRNVLERNVPPPSVYNPEVKAPLDEIVLALLQRESDKRTPSAEVLVRQLAALADEAATDAQIAAWMDQTFAARKAQRRSLEGHLLKEASLSWATGEGATPQLRSAFPGTHETASMLAVSNESMRTPRTSPGTLPPPTAQSVRPRRARWLVAVLLLAVAGLATALILRRRERAAEPTTPTLAAAPATAPIAAPAGGAIDPGSRSSTVGLVLYVMPEGTSVRVDASREAHVVGPEGSLVPVPASKHVVLHLSKGGYEAKDVAIDAPAVGTSSLYLNLSKEGADEETVAAAEPEDDKADDKVDGPRNDRKKPKPAPRREQRGRDRRVETSGKADPDVARFARVEIRSNPAGAAVRVDGSSRGVTPLTVQVTPGKAVSVELSKSGYVSWSGSAVGNTDQALVMNIPLSAEPTPAVARTEPRDEPVDAGVVAAAEVHDDLSRKPAKPDVKPTDVPPAKPAVSSAPVMVAASRVKKTSGQLPTVRVRTNPDEPPPPATTKPLATKICVDTGGSVTSVSVTDVPDAIGSLLKSAVKGWRFEPQQADGHAVSFCFKTALKLPIEAQ